MSALCDLESAFQAYLLDGDGEIVDRIVSSGTATAAERLQVYANAYRLRLIEALAKDYPSLRTLLGEDGFSAMARGYIDRFPSHYRSLRWFGRHLAKYLRNTKPHSDRPVLGEMAEFEWMMGESFDSLDTPVLGVDAMAGIAPHEWAGLHFAFQPGLRRLRLRWNVTALWKAAHDTQPLPVIECAPAPIEYLMWRRDMKVYWRPMTAEEGEALTCAAMGECFAALCERICEHVGVTEAPLRAASLLRQWLTDGLISRISRHAE